MIRKTLRKPSARKPASRKRKFFARAREEFSFHFWVDVTALVASIATVVTLLLLLNDRPAQANIAAWTLLQSYLQGDKRAQFDEGQGFALQTLAKNSIPLEKLDGHGMSITDADLRGVDMANADLSDTLFESVNLTGSIFFGASLRGASIKICKCREVDFHYTDLSDASFELTDLTSASFKHADISDLVFWVTTRLDSNALVNACYEKGHPPSFIVRTGTSDFEKCTPDVAMPKDPQGKACSAWNETWINRDKQAAALSRSSATAH